MSLLLQALQKAAKNREAGAPAPEPSEPAAPEQPAAAELPAAFSLDKAEPTIPDVEHSGEEAELALAEEDLFEPEEVPPAGGDDRFEPFQAAEAPGASQAAMFMRASENKSAGWLDWARDHPVHVFAVAAGVFLLFYGAYVYLQIFNPGLLRGEFFAQELVAKTPAPAQQRVTPAGSPKPVSPATPATPGPAPLAGLPSTPPQTPVTAPTTAPAVPTPKQPPASPAPGAAPQTVVAAAPQAIAPASGDTALEASAKHSAGPKQRRQARPTPTQSIADAALENQIASKSPSMDSSAPPPQLLQAYQALQDGKLDQAETLYREVLQRDQNNVDALLGLASIAAHRGSSQQAEGFYSRVLELEPSNSAAQAGVIELLGQGDPVTSEARLKQLIARDPSAALYFRLGNFYARQEQWPGAQAAYFQAYQMQPDNADYAYNLAIGLEHLSQPKPALTYYRKALELSFQKGRANFDQQRVIERVGQLSARVD